MRRTFTVSSAVRRACAAFALTAVLVGAAAGCGQDNGSEPAEEISQRSEGDRDTCTNGGQLPDCALQDVVSTTTTAPTTTTPPPTEPPPPPPPPTTPPTTAAPPPPPEPEPEAPPADDGSLRSGASGDAVVALQGRLVELGYWIGEVDGGYGLTTQQAVLAFQKAEGLGRDGVAGPETLARLAAAGRPTASGSGDMIEIDLERQLLFIIRGGAVEWVFNTSTGKSSTPTPPGTFTIDREIDGYRHAELGVLYRPKYFNGGIAIHGYTSIPGYPASHGCTRVSNPAIDYLWSSGQAPIGTTVWVH